MFISFKTYDWLYKMWYEVVFIVRNEVNKVKFNLDAQVLSGYKNGVQPNHPSYHIINGLAWI